MGKKSKEEISQIIKESDLTSTQIEILMMELSIEYRNKVMSELYNTFKTSIKKLQLENKNLKERLKEKSNNKSGTI
ncbi:MAG: hypothetical protein J1E16_06420 [Muribaculaceae bacterium]|nr:hypothetical protein [Muribaculaceae bacterium]